METEVEDKGRITIPAQIRRDLGIARGEKLDITAKDGALVLRRKKIVSVSDMKGIIGRSQVKLEDIEEAPGKEEWHFILNFVDSNIFIYHMSSDPKFGKTAGRILSRIENGEEKAITSTLVITQVASYLKWRKRSDAIPMFVEFLQSLPNLTKTETTFADYVEMKKLKSINWKNWDDLVIASQMRRLSLTKIYSNDSDFDSIDDVERIFD